MLSKSAIIDKDLIGIKLKESRIVFSTDSLISAIYNIKKTWAALEPMIRHRLEAFNDVKDAVTGRLASSELIS